MWNGENIQPVEEIQAKLVLHDHSSKVKMGGSHQARVRLGPGAPQPFEFPLLQHAQQFRLEFQRKIADLIQEHRSAVGHLESADALDNGTRKSASFVPKELAFQ